MSIFRKLLIEEIQRNGGWRGSRESFALEYDVSLCGADLRFDSLLPLATLHHGLNINALTPFIVDIETWRNAWDPDDIYLQEQSYLCHSLNDDDGRRTYSPKTAARYGLPYHTSFPKKYRRKTDDDQCFYSADKPGWIRVNPYCCDYYAVKFGLHGRGGKHLCVESFEGRDLGMSSDDLIGQLLDEDGTYYHCIPNAWCQKLLAMIQEWKVMFTPKAASDELEYQAAYRLSEEFASLVHDSGLKAAHDKITKPKTRKKSRRNTRSRV